jgi:hypothetical protein
MNTILILKPIIDALYEEMKDYKEKTDKRIKELEAEVAVLRVQRKRPVVAQPVVVLEDSDDEAFAKAAQAPPTSSPPPVTNAQVEIKNELEKNTSTIEEDIKPVKMIGGKDVKEYMKDYQRSYRKKQKNIILNL